MCAAAATSGSLAHPVPGTCKNGVPTRTHRSATVRSQAKDGVSQVSNGTDGPARTILRGRAGYVLLAVGAAASVAAVLAAPRAAAASASQVWPPFVLVAGLLLVGILADADGLFLALGSRSSNLPGGGLVLFSMLLLLVAATTAVLNLDTAVVFLTPILLQAARERGLEDLPFLYGSVFMVNAGSLFLPGANLTNLLVLSGQHVPGSIFAWRMLPASLGATAVTAAVLVVWFRRPLRAIPRPVAEGPAPLRMGLGLLGTGVAATLVIALPAPALPVLGVGVLFTGLAVLRGRIRPSVVVAVVHPALLCGLCGFAVAVGTLTRVWAAPQDLLHSLGRWGTAATGAVASVAINNLPAAVLLAPHATAHPRALLLGLDLGPGLAVSGSLSALLWLQIARRAGARPSARTYSLIGIVLVPLAITTALALTLLLAPRGF